MSHVSFICTRHICQSCHTGYGAAANLQGLFRMLSIDSNAIDANAAREYTTDESNTERSVCNAGGRMIVWERTVVGIEKATHINEPCHTCVMSQWASKRPGERGLYVLSLKRTMRV